MQGRHLFGWLALAVGLLLNPGSASSGEEDATEVIGALGGSATFQLKISESFTFITWLKKEANGDSSNMALLDPAEKPCKFTVLLPALERRLNASGDCQGLQVRDLRRGDSGKYTAQIQLVGGKEPLKETFELKVYKRLSEADLAVHCHKTGNGSRQLNCSTGEEEDATVSWAEASQAEPWGKFALLALSVNEEDPNVTCQARNPIGEASRRVSVQEICEAVDPTARSMTVPPLKDGDPGKEGRKAGIAVGVLLVLGLLAVFLGCWWKNRAAGRKHLDFAEANEACHTLYAEVENVPRDGGRPQPRPRGKPAKAKNENIQTIYTTVDHCAQNPSQTDDEKMWKGRQRSPKPGGKTIYSEIANSQESEEQSIKTVYETVNNPQLPRGAEYNDII
ncbi:hypothetical protein JRQ81_009578 [Phrynocephalus forsythii]|uniref:Uncharacterized protein n=1 Tax=Phrynocephalus forsythii TaxID=171643 RepID=A0A9Q0XA55_9SAUR|nr:hypothetical protein JRQ81_009578 [Phrynocephalus forsythii]